MQSTYLCEESLNLLFTLCSKSFQPNESYENKIKILKNEKILLNDVNYTNNKTIDDTDSEPDDTNDTDSEPDDTNDTDSEKLNAFFIDGAYRRVGAGLPTCVFPNGPLYEGNYTIFSNYECADKTKPFLQKNILGQTVANNNEARISLITFNILNNTFVSNNFGNALSGRYYIKGDMLYTNYKGYSSQIGKLCKMQHIYQKTPGGYSLRQNLWNVNENKYEIFAISQLIRL